MLYVILTPTNWNIFLVGSVCIFLSFLKMEGMVEKQREELQ